MSGCICEHRASDARPEPAENPRVWWQTPGKLAATG
jgi:hypothetical protein